MSVTPKQITKKTLNLKERYEVIKLLETSKQTQTDIAQQFGVDQSQISRIKTNKEQIKAEYKSNFNNKRRRR